MRIMMICALSVALAVPFFPACAGDLLSLAVLQMREKDYGEAYTLALKSPEAPQRSYILGAAAYRLGRWDEAARLLAEAEPKLPLAGDYAALYQAESLLKLKRYAEAAGKVASIARLYPSTQLMRKAEKLSADVLFESGDMKGALKPYQLFVEKYASGADSVDALYRTALCREGTGDVSGAAGIYRNIWLNNPSSQQAKKAFERIKELEKNGVRMPAYTQEELFRRASSLYSQSEYGSALQAFQSIPTDGQPPVFIARIDLKTGMTLYRQRNYRQAEKSLAKVSSGPEGIRSEARLWRARALDRLNQDEQAFAQFMELAREGKQQEFAADALFDAAALRRNMGKYAEAAQLFDQLRRQFPDAKLFQRAGWESAWCRYLAGDYAVAAEQFRALLKDENVREKALYWLGRSLENMGNAEATLHFRRLLDEYPTGFYAAWRREKAGISDTREALGNRNTLAELPILPGYEKPRLLAQLGLYDEARSEVAVIRKKTSDKGGSAGLARVYLEMGDFSSAIVLFKQNRPARWDKTTLPFWSVGYPRAYSEPVSRNASLNALPESLIFALMRAESNFSPAIKSHAGAIGLMQLMPATAKLTARDKAAFNVQRLTDPEYNIKLGTKHLRDLLKSYDGDVVYSLAAYNAGANAVARWRKNMKELKKDEFIESIPYQETRDYVKKIYASAATYRQLYGLK